MVKPRGSDSMLVVATSSYITDIMDFKGFAFSLLTLWETGTTSSFLYSSAFTSVQTLK